VPLPSPPQHPAAGHLRRRGGGHGTEGRGGKEGNAVTQTDKQNPTLSTPEGNTQAKACVEVPFVIHTFHTHDPHGEAFGVTKGDRWMRMAWESNEIDAGF